MMTALDRLIRERQEWRENRRRRRAKVSERGRAGWQNFCAALHREVVLYNARGQEMLGVRRREQSLEVFRTGLLSPLLSFTLDDENGQILYHSPLHEESVMIPPTGRMVAAFLGTLFVVNADGHMVRFSYAEAAQCLLGPMTGN